MPIGIVLCRKVGKTKQTSNSTEGCTFGQFVTTGTHLSAYIYVLILEPFPQTYEIM